MTTLPLFPTSLVGSYPQPEWLIDREKLAGRFPPRVRARELWRVEGDHLAQAQEDATVVAIRAPEEAELDIITDGEMRRESYSNHFATALDGLDLDNPGTAFDRSGHPNPVPRVVGPIERPKPVGTGDVRFLRGHTARPIMMTVPGRSRCLSRRRTTSTGRRIAGNSMRMSATRRSKICSTPGRTSCRSTNPIWRAGPMLLALTGKRR